MQRLYVAMAAFAVLAFLAWQTLSDTRLRVVTLLILGMFALRTWLRRHDTLREKKNSD